LGAKRIEKTLETVNHIDLAILVITSSAWGEFEERLPEKFNTVKVPFIIAHNKSDIARLSSEVKLRLLNLPSKPSIVEISVTKNEGQ